VLFGKRDLTGRGAENECFRHEAAIYSEKKKNISVLNTEACKPNQIHLHPFFLKSVIE